MAYSEELADRVRRELAGREGLSERRMFGGLTFLLHGHMCCGVVGDDLVLRLGPDGAARALSRPHARPMDFTGRPLRGFVYVGPDGVRSGAALRDWVGEAAAFCASLPPK